MALVWTGRLAVQAALSVGDGDYRDAMKVRADVCENGLHSNETLCSPPLDLSERCELSFGHVMMPTHRCTKLAGRTPNLPKQGPQLALIGAGFAAPWVQIFIDHYNRDMRNIRCEKRASNGRAAGPAAATLGPLSPKAGRSYGFAVSR